MKRIFWVLGILMIGQVTGVTGGDLAFWISYDPGAESLEPEVVREWEDEIGVHQLIRYRLGTLEGTNRKASPVIAAYYGFPLGASAESRVPGVVHIHGGGQRADQRRVSDWVRLGYAAISINWGGKVLEGQGTPNTDWDGLAAGFDRPGVGHPAMTHHNLIRPDEHTLFGEPHPLNSSWSLIAMSARRALTFLESRPEVDSSRLGVEGHSMGGRATVLTAIDSRVKAASPSVGGSGFLYQDLWGLPGSARRMSVEDGLPLYSQWISCQSYWPHIKAPVLFLQASNDFNAPTDLVIKGMSFLPEDTARAISMAPHLNHRFTHDTSAARFMWMEAHLKEDFVFPGESPSELILDTPDRVPRFRVTVDDSAGLPIKRVQIFYGYARDSRIRFWRSANVERESDRIFYGSCPVFDTDEPLFAFANITYRMPRTLPARPGSRATDELTVTSEYQGFYPEELKAAGVVATESLHREIDDFSRGWQDWYRLNPENTHHWFYATRKLVDPSWMGPEGGRLVVDVLADEGPNQLAIGLEVNDWQSYTGRKKDTYHAIVDLGKPGKHSISLAAGDFRNEEDSPLGDWDEVTELTFTPAFRVGKSKANWKGKPLRLEGLRWEGGKQVRRPYPHEKRVTAQNERGSFENEFQKAIDDSVELENQGRASDNSR